MGVINLIIFGPLWSEIKKFVIKISTKKQTILLLLYNWWPKKQFSRVSIKQIINKKTGSNRSLMKDKQISP